MEHAIRLTEPVLIIADAARGKRIAARCSDFETVSLDIDLPVEDAIAPLLESVRGDEQLPELSPEDDATILFTSGSTGDAKGALSTHRAVTTGTYAYASGLIVLLGILTKDGYTELPDEGDGE